MLPDFYPQTVVVDEHTGHTFVAGSRQRTATIEAVAVLDTRTGAVQRVIDTTLFGGGAGCCQLWELVDVAAGAIAVGGQGGGAVYLLDAHTGAVLGTAGDSIGMALLPGDPAGRILNVVATRTYSGVRVLDGRSDTTVTSISCPATMGAGFQRWIASITLDMPLRRLFVLADNRAQGPGVCIFDLMHDHARFVPAVNKPGFQVIDAWALDQRTGHLFVATDGATGGETSSVLTMFDARTGQILRRTAIGAYPSRILVASNRVVIVCGDYPNPGELDLIDARSGRLLLTRTSREAVYTLADDPLNGDVIVTYADESMGRLDLHTGRVLVRVDTHAASTPLAVDPSSHRTYTVRLRSGRVQSRGELQVRDTRTGAVLHTTAIHTWIGGSMAVDTILHRGFVSVDCPAATADAVSWLPNWLRDRVPGLARPLPIPATSSCIMVLDTSR